MKPTAKDLIDAAPGYLGVPYYHLDCQAFVERCLRDIGIDKNLPGSNAWSREVKNHGWVGSPEDCKKKFGKVPPGAFLFILKQDGKEPAQYKEDGIGNASHIGIYTALTGAEMCRMGGVSDKYDYGNGAIHSSSTRECVCTSKFEGKTINGGWNRVGIWNQIDYDGGGGKVEPYKAKVIGGGLNLRTRPDKNAERIIQMPDGSIVTVMDETGGWSYVQFNAFEGYCMSEYLERVEDFTGDVVAVPREQLQMVYDEIGDWLGLRG